MIAALKKLFELPERETGEERLLRTRLAAAALLIETARADFTENDSEQAELAALLCDSLGLGKAEVDGLIAQAAARLDEATSLYDFTHVINESYSPQQKLELIDAMWRVAYADGQLDKYEEALIRQVAELTYVPHADYIRAKLSARA